jgi:cytochrome c oxidase subunit 3
VSITILFVLAPIGAIVAWWLSQQRLTAKPWLEVGAIDDFPGTGASSHKSGRGPCAPVKSERRWSP